MDKEMIEYYHNNGLMPDLIYYQINGKSAQENYLDILNKRSQKYKEEIIKRYKGEKLEKQSEEELNITLEKTLNDLLNKFNA